MATKLAIKGGIPVRTGAFPVWPIYGKEEEKALTDVARSGKWGKLDGKETEKFEKQFSNYQDCKYGIAVNNGTIALQIALMAAGIKAGDDEVLVPPYTFLATATSVVMCNATPVFVDIEPETYNIDPKAIEKAITGKTKAIMPVHIAGLPCNMDAIMAIAKRHNLVVIEDSAHAHGAIYKGKKAGSIGDAGCFSFQSTKNLNCGEGGIITTNNEEIAEMCRSIHNCGRIKGGAWYEHHVIAGNFRIGEFQSAVLNCQFARLEEQAQLRAENGKFLSKALAGIPGIRTQATTDDVRHAHHLMLVMYDKSQYGVERQVYVKAMQAEGIPLGAGYMTPLYKQPLFTNKAFGPFNASGAGVDYSKVNCPACEKACGEEGCWLTQNVLLGSRQDMEQIADAFEKVYKNKEQLL
jgi:dTDP-4-amino-4,6-dideoxygalactose transaminase